MQQLPIAEVYVLERNSQSFNKGISIKNESARLKSEEFINKKDNIVKIEGCPNCNCSIF